MVDGPSSPFDSGVDPEAVASVAGSIEIANEVVVPGAVTDVVDVVGATVVDVVPVVDVVGATVVDVVPVVDVVGATVVDAVVAGSATGSGAVDPHANPMHASTATAVEVVSKRTLRTLLLRLYAVDFTTVVDQRTKREGVGRASSASCRRRSVERDDHGQSLSGFLPRSRPKAPANEMTTYWIPYFRRMAVRTSR